MNLSLKLKVTICNIYSGQLTVTDLDGQKYRVRVFLKKIKSVCLEQLLGLDVQDISIVFVFAFRGLGQIITCIGKTARCLAYRA